MRLFQYLDYLRAENIDVHVSPLLNDGYISGLYTNKNRRWFAVLQGYSLRFLALFRLARFDVILIEKELFPNFPAWFEWGLSAFGRRYIVDYDDAIFHNYDQSRNVLKRLLAKKIDHVMHYAGLVTCGNEYLVARAIASASRQVEIIPTVIDLQRYSAPKRHHSGNTLIIGWIGSPSTVKYLDMVAPALAELAKTLPIRLRVIGARFVYRGLAVDCRNWSEDSEAGEIQKLDIGLMPLHNLPFERGKCGYKLIQYMACGLPVIASPVGVNVSLIQQGKNGFLADAHEDWIKFLRYLGENTDQRERMGAYGRHIVEQSYCLQKTAPRLVELLEQFQSNLG